MAKRTGPAPEAAPAAPPPANGTSKAIALGTDLAPAPAVIEWDSGNGRSIFQSGELPPEPPPEGAEPATAKAEEPKPAEEPADPAVARADAPDDAAKPEGDAEKPPEPAAQAPKRLSPEQRRAALAALDRERNQRSLEVEARQQRERADKLEADSRRPLAERLKALTAEERERVLDMLLVGGEAAPEPAPAAPHPEIAALKAELAELKADRQTRVQAEQDQQIQRAVTDIAATIKDEPVPLVHALPGGYELVLQTAHKAWIDAGKSRPMKEFVAGAADVVEEYYRGQHPRLAALADAKAAAGGEPEPKPAATPAPRAPATSIGKRTAARPDAKPAELPMDRYQRDAQIKKDMGWT